MGLTVAELRALDTISHTLPRITEALERIAAALEKDITDDISTLDEHFRTIIEMQTGITKDGVGHE